MVQYYYQNLGTSWKIGIEGDNEQEILEHFNGFFNYGATDKEPQWSEINLCVFSTDEARLMKCLREMAEMKLSLASKLEIQDIIDQGSPKVRHYYEKLIAREVARRRAEFKPKKFNTNYTVIEPIPFDENRI